jgi:hypothetical protein
VIPRDDARTDVLDIAGIANEFRMTRSGARRALKRGDFGAYFLVGRRAFVRRASMLAAVAAREVTPAPRSPIPIPEAPEWAKALMRPRARGRG